MLADGRDDLAKSADKAAAQWDRAAENRDAVSDAYEVLATPPAIQQRAADAGEPPLVTAPMRAKIVAGLDETGMSPRMRADRSYGRSDASAAIADLRDLLTQAEGRAEDMLLIGPA